MPTPMHLEHLTQQAETGVRIKFMKRVTGAVAGSGIILGLVAAPANADTTVETMAAAPPPPCVSSALDDSGFTDELIVFNRCGTNQRIKVVLAFHTDKPCTTVAADTTKSFSWNYPGRFDRLEKC